MTKDELEKHVDFLEDMRKAALPMILMNSLNEVVCSLEKLDSARLKQFCMLIDYHMIITAHTRNPEHVQELYNAVKTCILTELKWRKVK